MLTYKTTIMIALDKETGEEMGRQLITGHSLFTVANRDCTAETCGNSEGQGTPVRLCTCTKAQNYDIIVSYRIMPCLTGSTFMYPFLCFSAFAHVAPAAQSFDLSGLQV